MHIRQGNHHTMSYKYIKWIQVEKTFLTTVQSNESWKDCNVYNEPQSHASHLEDRGLSIRDAEACT